MSGVWTGLLGFLSLLHNISISLRKSKDISFKNNCNFGMMWICSGALASQDPIHLRETARRALEQFDLQQCPEDCLQHAMTQRFCSAQWSGLTPEYPELPLRPLMERLAKGPGIGHWGSIAVFQ